MDLKKELEFWDEPGWIEAMLMIAADDGDIELFNKILDNHPEMYEYFEKLYKEYEIELQE